MTANPMKQPEGMPPREHAANMIRAVGREKAIKLAAMNAGPWWDAVLGALENEPELLSRAYTRDDKHMDDARALLADARAWDRQRRDPGAFR